MGLSGQLSDPFNEVQEGLDKHMSQVGENGSWTRHQTLECGLREIHDVLATWHQQLLHLLSLKKW